MSVSSTKKRSILTRLRGFLRDNKDSRNELNSSSVSSATMTVNTNVATAGDKVLTPAMRDDKVSTGFDGVYEFLKVVKESSDVFVPLKSAVGGILACIDAYKRTSGNYDEMERLLTRLDRLSSLAAARLGHCEIRTARQRIDSLVRILDMEYRNIENMKKRGMLARLAQNAQDEDDLIMSCRTITEALDEFQLELGMSVERNTHDILKNIVFQSLCRSKSAAFTAAIGNDTVTRGPCTHGTRVAVIDEIFDWAVSDKSNAAPIYWLNGLAGTGKTTIAYTICQRLEAANIPFVSFFCSRQLDSRDTTLLIPTICRDLAELFQSYASEVVPVLETDSKLAHAILPLQIKKLLAWPWRDSRRQRDGLRVPIVIVDALDESDAGIDFLKELLRVVHHGVLPEIKFLVTSRPDPGVVKLCESFPRDAVCHLHEVAMNEVREDITKFLKEKLPNLRGEAELEILSQQSGGLFIYAATIVRFLSPRTPLSSREQLKQLQGILNIWPNSSGMRDVLLLDQLYQQVLAHAFMFVSTDIQRERIVVLHTILCAEHPIPLPVIAELASETCDEETVSNIVQSLHAAIYISTKDQCVYWYHQSFADFVFSIERANFILPISPHSSLEKIQIDTHCDAPVIHGLLAASCFRIMQSLRFNICELESSFLLDREVPDLGERANKNIRQALRYTLKHWANHLHKAASSCTNGLYEDLCDFLHNRLLFWMEALNLIGANSKYRLQIHLLREWLKQVPFNDLAEYVADVSRFTTHFTGSPASLSTPHLYLSSLATWPRSSSIAETWGSRFSRVPLFSRPEGVSTMPLVSIHVNDSRDRLSVVLSGDGTCIASQLQGAIRIWDTATGELLRQLSGASITTYRVGSLAISYDGTRIVSGNRDGSVMMWDVTTGEQLWQMDHCYQQLTCFMTLSHDGTLIMYVVDDKEKWEKAITEEQRWIPGNPVSAKCSVKLLDARLVGYLQQYHRSRYKLSRLFKSPCFVFAFSPDGTIFVTDSRTTDYCMIVFNCRTNDKRRLVGHTAPPTSVALSADGTRVVSGSADGSVRVWDTITGKLLKKLEVPNHPQHTIYSVAFSHDGGRIVSATYSFIRMWDGTPEEGPREQDGHTRSISSLEFYGEGTDIVSSSRDGSIQLWDGTSGRQLRKLKHDGAVTSMAISHDGTRIVSTCANSGCVWVWDTTTGEELWRLYGHKAHVRSVAISADGKCIVSGSGDCSVRVRDMETGKLLGQFGDEELKILSVLLSSRGEYIVSSSGHHSVQLLDISTGVKLTLLQGSTTAMTCVALSFDGTHIVSGHEDGSVRLWNVMTGEQLMHLIGHTGSVHSVALSHDGTRIVSASADSSVRVWDGTSGAQVRQLHGHSGSVNSVALSYDGTTVVSGGNDTCIRVWGNLTTDIPWVMDEDGWVLYGSNKFMWISPDLRDLFLHPYCTSLISRHGYSQVDFLHSKLGTDWCECYTP